MQITTLVDCRTPTEGTRHRHTMMTSITLQAENALKNNPPDDETRYNYVLAKECAAQQDNQQNQDNQDQDKKDENKDDHPTCWKTYSNVYAGTMLLLIL